MEKYQVNWGDGRISRTNGAEFGTWFPEISQYGGLPRLFDHFGLKEIKLEQEDGNTILIRKTEDIFDGKSSKG